MHQLLPAAEQGGYPAAVAMLLPTNSAPQSQPPLAQRLPAAGPAPSSSAPWPGQAAPPSGKQIQGKVLARPARTLSRLGLRGVHS